jgi:hypothetical protein
VHEGDVDELARPEQDGVLVPQQGVAGSVARVDDELGAVEGRAQ